MKIAYVSGPYTHKTEWGTRKNIEAAADIAAQLWDMGFGVICPHTNTAFFGGAATYHQFMEADLIILERCDLVVMTPNWQDSNGARMEHAHALEKEVPVYYWPGGISALVGDKVPALAT